MKAKFLIPILLCMVLLVPQVSAFEWCEWIPFWDCQEPIILEDHTTYDTVSNVCSATRGGMQVDIYPCNMQDADGKNIEQFVNFKWDGVNTKNISWVFMYPNDIASGKIEVLMNVTEDYDTIGYENAWGSKVFTNITSSQNLGTPNASCEFGNDNNTQMYQIEQYNNQTSIICFTDFENLGGGSYRASGNYDKQVTIVQQRTVERWVDKTNLVDFLGHNLNVQGYYYYQVYSVRFDPGKEYQTRWTYTPKNSKIRGKWNILGYESETGLMNAIENNQYIFVDPWWNNSWNYKKQITGLIGSYPSFNITYDAAMNSDFSDLRFLNSTETIELNYTIRDYVASEWAYVTVYTSNASSMYMYFGNPSATTTSDVNATFFFPDQYFPFDDDIAANAEERTHGYNISSFGAGASVNSDGVVLNMKSFSGTTVTQGANTTHPLDLSSTYTVCLFMNNSGARNFETLLHYSGSSDFLFRTDTNDQVQLQTVNGNGTVDGTSDIADDTFHFLCGSWDSVTTNRFVSVDGLIETQNSGATFVNGNQLIEIAQFFAAGSSFSWTGGIDELFFYDYVLSNQTMKDLASMTNQSPTFGVLEELSSLNITLLYPENGYKSSNNSLELSCICQSSTGCSSLNMTINDAIVNSTTNSTANQNLSLIYSDNAFADGSYNWFCTGGNLEEDTNSTTFSFLIDTILPSVTISSPTSPYTVTQFNESVQVNWTINDTNRDICWYAFPGQEILQNDSYSITPTWNFTNKVLRLGYDINLSITNGNYDYISDVPEGCFIEYTKLEGNFLFPSGNTTLDCYFDNGSTQRILNKPYGGVDTINFIELYTHYNQTFVSCDLNTTTINYPSSNPDNATFYLFANDTVGNENNDSLLLLKTSSSPNITIDSPVNTFGVLENGESIDLNYSITNNTVLDTCWYSYNGTNTTITCNQNTSFIYVSGKDSITLYANTTLGNQNSETKTWIILFTVNNIVFDPTSYETDYKNFVYNITFFTEPLSISTKLFYDGFNYSSISNCDGNTCIITNNIDLPLISQSGTNNSLYWQITIFNGTGTTSYTSQTYYQELQEVLFDECNATLNTTTLNYSAYDEEDKTRISLFEFEGDFQYYLGSGTVKKNLSMGNNSVTNYIDFCYTPTNRTLYLDSQIQYYKNDSSKTYKERNYYTDNASLTNTSQDIFLYLLDEDLATSFILEVLDQSNDAVSSAFIYIQRCYVDTGNCETVQIAKTDENGKTLGFYEVETVDYKHLIYKDGELLLDQSKAKVFPEETPYTLIFRVGDAILYPWVYLVDNPSVTISLSHNSTTNTTSFSWIDASGEVSEGTLKVYQNLFNVSDELICESSASFSSATVTCDLTGYDGSFVAYAYLDGEVVDIIRYSIDDNFSTFGNYGVMIGFFIILFVTLLFIWNPTAMIIMHNVATIFVWIIGFIAFSPIYIFAMMGVSVLIIILLKT